MPLATSTNTGWEIGPDGNVQPAGTTAAAAMPHSDVILNSGQVASVPTAYSGAGTPLAASSFYNAGYSAQDLGLNFYAGWEKQKLNTYNLPGIGIVAVNPTGQITALIPQAGAQISLADLKGKTPAEVYNQYLSPAQTAEGAGTGGTTLASTSQMYPDYQAQPSTARPWEGVQAPLETLYGEAIEQYIAGKGGEGPQYFPGMEGYAAQYGTTQPPTVAPLPEAVTTSQEQLKTLAAPGGQLETIAQGGAQALDTVLAGGEIGKTVAGTAAPGTVGAGVSGTLGAVALPSGGATATATAPTVTAPTIDRAGIPTTAPTVTAPTIDTTGAQTVATGVAAPTIDVGAQKGAVGPTTITAPTVSREGLQEVGTQFGAPSLVDRSVQQALTPALQQMLSGKADLSQVQAVTEAAARPLVQQFERAVLPGIGQEATAAGQAAGSRRGVAEGIAAEALQQQIGDIGTQVAYQAYRDALAQQQAGVGEAGKLVAQEAGYGLQAQQLTAETQLALRSLGIDLAKTDAAAQLQAAVASGQLSVEDAKIAANVAMQQAGYTLEARKLQGDLETSLRGMDIDVSKTDAANKLAAAIQAGQLSADHMRLLGDLAKTQAGFDIQADITSGEFNLAAQKIVEQIRNNKTLEALQGAQVGAGLMEEQLSAAMKGLALMPGIMGSLMMPSQVLGQVGAEEFAYDQTVINEAMKQWTYDETQPLRSLQELGAILTGAPMGQDPAIYQQAGYSPSQAQRFAQSAGAGIGTWGMLMTNPVTAPYAGAAGITMALLSYFS